jgi:hypothetical protein
VCRDVAGVDGRRGADGGEGEGCLGSAGVWVGVETAGADVGSD